MCAWGLCKARVCCWNSSSHEGFISLEESNSKLMVPNKYVSNNLCAFVFYNAKMERIRLHTAGMENKRKIKPNRDAKCNGEIAIDFAVECNEKICHIPRWKQFIENEL